MSTLNERNTDSDPRISLNNYPEVIPSEARPQGVIIIIVVGFVFLIFFAHSPSPWVKNYRRGLRVPPSPCCCGINKTVHKDQYSITNISKDVFSLSSYNNLDALIAVHTLPDHFSQREAIRDTWANTRVLDPLPLQIQVVFFVGRSADEGVETKLYKEFNENDDLVVLDMIEDESNRTLKSVAMLAWVDGHCPQLKFLMKLEDDVFLNIPLLEQFLDIISGNKSAIFGRVKEMKNHRRKYPNFINGATYIVTGDAIRSLCRCCMISYLFPLNDAYITGLCARRTGVQLINEPVVFGDRQSIQSCNFTRFISIDDVSPMAMEYVWKKRHSMEELCSPVKKMSELVKNRYAYTVL